MKYTYTCPAPKGKKRYSCKSFAIRELTGKDEVLAAKNAESLGTPDAVGMEMIRLSICEVDGQPTEQPYHDFDEWNAATRQLAANAFREINGTDEGDLADFLSGGRPSE